MSTVLASIIINVSESDHVFNCMAILEINSSVPVPLGEIMCVSGAMTGGTEDIRTFPYTVFKIGKLIIHTLIRVFIVEVAKITL